MCFVSIVFVFFQAEDGIRDLVRSRGLGDVYKRQGGRDWDSACTIRRLTGTIRVRRRRIWGAITIQSPCLLYTSDAADERSSVDLGGRRIIKKKIEQQHRGVYIDAETTQMRGIDSNNDR